MGSGSTHLICLYYKLDTAITCNHVLALLGRRRARGDGGSEGAALRVGFIGTGRHATNAIYPALRPAGLELVATCSRDEARAREQARAFGAGRWHAGVDALIADAADLDAILVVVPPSAYEEVVAACLEAGKPVFVEKPAAADLAQLVRMEAAAEAAGLPVMVGYMKRFARAHRVALDFIHRPDFGPVTSIHGKFVMGAGFGSLRNYLVDNPVHMLDLMRLFAGEVLDVSAASRSLDDQRHALSLLLEFDGGAVGTAQLGTTASFHQENELLEVVGEGHSVTVTNLDTVTCRGPSGHVLVDRPTYTVPLRPNLTGDVMGFVPELEHFRAVVLDGVACESDITSARQTFELVERIWQQVG